MSVDCFQILRPDMAVWSICQHDNFICNLTVLYYHEHFYYFVKKIFIEENVKLNLTHLKSHQELTELYITDKLYTF